MVVPLGGLEPPHLAPEASALSTELQGQQWFNIATSDHKFQVCDCVHHWVLTYERAVSSQLRSANLSLRLLHYAHFADSTATGGYNQKVQALQANQVARDRYLAKLSREEASQGIESLALK